jgi:putative peptidoglycan lipid II flippase
MQDMRRPVILAVYALIINVFASVMLMGPMKHSGLALATTIAAFFNFIAVMVALRHRIGRFGLKKMASSIARILAASAAMGLAIYLAGPWEAGALRNLIISSGLWGKAGLAVYIAVTVTGGLGVFLLVAFALGLKEVSVVYDIIKRKIKK